MPSHVYVQFYGREGGDMPQPVQILADKVEKVDGALKLTLGEEVVGELNMGTVVGWWIERTASVRSAP